MYVTVVPAKNDGKTIHRVTVKDVTVDAFWSISVYNAKGSSSRTRSTHTFNNVTGTKAADGSITVQFGGCDAKTPNCLPISPGGTTGSGCTVRARSTGRSYTRPMFCMRVHTCH